MRERGRERDRETDRQREREREREREVYAFLTILYNLILVMEVLTCPVVKDFNWHIMKILVNVSNFIENTCERK